MAQKPTDKVQLNLVKVSSRQARPSFFSRFASALDDPGEWSAVIRFFLYPRPLNRQQFFGARIVIWLALVFFSVQLMLNGYDAWIAQFLHNLNLPVHETGHIVFGFFRPVITSLGGSLFQIIMPLVFCLALWLKPRDLFGASVGLWWAFENFIDVAVYINDAMYMRLTLISGDTGNEAPYGFHDWNFILSEIGLLLKYDSIANAVYIAGYIGMTLCCLWGLWSLWYYWKYQRNS